MESYEMLYIIKPNLSKEDSEKVQGKINSAITDGKGKILENVDLGTKTFAQEFKKLTQGQYVLVRFTADNKILDKIQELFVITEELIRQLTVKAESVLPEVLKPEILTLEN